jgi:dTDP-4-amino-4,6-dideoxygalactose transaminase
MLPTISLGRGFSSGSTCIPSVLDQPNIQMMPSGRLALLSVLNALQVTEHGTVMLPAYHCPSMVEPVEWAGMKPLFYRMNRDLSPNFTDVKRKAESHVTAILVAHMFGVPCDLSSLRKFCDERKIILIEDCAHMPFGRVGENIVGTIGDYSIASPRKFYPTVDGGAVLKVRGEMPRKLQSLGIKYNAKALLNTLEHTFEFSNFPILRRLSGHRSSHARKEHGAEAAIRRKLDEGEASDAGYMEPQFNPANVIGRMSIVSDMLIEHVSREALIEARRNNYKFLYEKLCESSALKPFFARADACSVPYVLPMYLNGSGALHEELLRSGVPVWRWDTLYPSDCEVSREYSKSLLQFPCHQSLKQTELNQLVTRIRRIVG